MSATPRRYTSDTSTALAEGTIAFFPAHFLLSSDVYRLLE